MHIMPCSFATSGCFDAAQSSPPSEAASEGVEIPNPRFTATFGSDTVVAWKGVVAVHWRGRRNIHVRVLIRTRKHTTFFPFIEARKAFSTLCGFFL